MQSDGERSIHEIWRASFEALSLEELGSQILPMMERAFDASTSLLYRIDEKGRPAALNGGFRDASPLYFERYASEDPLQSAGRRTDPWIVRASRLPEWKQYLDHPAYTELCHPNGLDYFIHLRIHGPGHLQPGMVGLLLARSIRGPDFDERDEMRLAQLLPPLEALARRSFRLEKLLGNAPWPRAILEADPRPKAALDLDGALLWISRRAEKPLGLDLGGSRALPPTLVHAARRLGALHGKKTASSPPPASLRLAPRGRPPIFAELRLARNFSGRAFVLVELEGGESGSRGAELAARFGLTGAESQVLHWIGRGLSNREIGGRLFISETTVRSHVAHILEKLGLRSRVQAALWAHGISPEGAEGAEREKEPCLPRAEHPRTRR